MFELGSEIWSRIDERAKEWDLGRDVHEESPVELVTSDDAIPVESTHESDCHAIRQSSSHDRRRWSLVEVEHEFGLAKKAELVASCLLDTGRVVLEALYLCPELPDLVTQTRDLEVHSGLLLLERPKARQPGRRKHHDGD